MNAVFGEENINTTQRALDAREQSMADGGPAINNHIFAIDEKEPGIGAWRST